MKKYFFPLIASLLASSLVWAGTISVGSISDQTGPIKAIGQSIKTVINAYFEQINAKGGVNGNTLKLIIKDDQYNPEKIPALVEELLKDNVSAFVTNVGSPTTLIALPMIEKAGVPLIAPYTGAGFLYKNPPDKMVFTLRPSYAAETGAMAKELLKKGLKPEQIGFLTQNDAFGNAGYEGAINAMKAMGVKNTAQLINGQYDVKSADMEEGLVKLLDSPTPLKAVIVMAPWKQAAKFLTVAKEEMPNTTFFVISVAASPKFIEAMKGNTSHIVFSQVLPTLDSSLPAVKEYIALLKQYAPQEAPNVFGLEGYIGAKIFVAALDKAGKNPTPASIVRALESLSNYNVGLDQMISYSPTHHQGLQNVYPTIIKDGQFSTVTWDDIKL